MSSNSNTCVAQVATPATGSWHLRSSMLGSTTKSTSPTLSNGINNAESTEPSQVVVILPSLPPPTYPAYHQPRNSPNVLDNFFGAKPTEILAISCRQDATVTSLPLYTTHEHVVTEREPSVCTMEDSEPCTLAQMLFFYGFLFFPFWLVGIYILVSPLVPTPQWEIGKTEDEKIQLLRVLRDAEKRWALCCLYAMFSLVIIVLLLVVIIKFGIMGSI